MRGAYSSTLGKSMTVDIAPLLTAVRNFPSRIRNQVEGARRKTYSKNGEIHDVKEWYGTTMSVDGVYSFDISSAGFKEILHVTPVVVFDDETFNAQTFASLNKVSTKSVTGRIVTGGSGSLFTSVGFQKRSVVTVMIKVVGI